MKKTQIYKNKLVYLGLSVLELSKIVMDEFSYDYVKPKYCEKSKLCYMDTDHFILHIKRDQIYDEIYNDITEDVEARFDTLNCELDRSLLKEKI